MQYWNIQFLNQNSQRSYPLADWGTKADSTNTIIIPDSFIVSLTLPVHAGLDVEPGRFFLKTLGIFPTGYNIGFGYDDGSTDPPLVATVNIAKATHIENRSYAVAGVDDFDDTVGHIAIGKLDEIDELPPGVYNFGLDDAPLEPDVIRPIIRGISSITIVNGQDRSPALVGDMDLIAGENMRIVASIVEGERPQITFSAIAGEGLNEECVCDEEGQGPPIRFINGIPPLPDGNFRMVGDDCLELSPITNGLQLSDRCSQPCCGCEQLDALKLQIHRFADGVATYQTFVGNLGSTVTQLNSVLMGSRLGDQGCVECG